MIRLLFFLFVRSIFSFFSSSSPSLFLKFPQGKYRSRPLLFPLWSVESTVFFFKSNFTFLLSFIYFFILKNSLPVEVALARVVVRIVI